MGAEISTKSFDVRIREDCTAKLYREIRWPEYFGLNPYLEREDIKNNKYYRTQLQSICSGTYYAMDRPNPRMTIGNRAGPNRRGVS